MLLLLARVPAVALLAARLSCSSWVSACDTTYEGGSGLGELIGSGVVTIMRLMSVLKGCSVCAWTAEMGRGVVIIEGIVASGEVYTGGLIRTFSRG